MVKEGKMKLEKCIKTPMIAALILQAICVVSFLILVLTQKSFYSEHITITETTIPPSFFIQCVIMLLYIVYYLVMVTTESDSRRVVGIIMIVVYIVIHILIPVVTALVTVAASRKGAEYLAAMNSIMPMVNFVVSPFSMIASVMVMVAISRYGIIGTSVKGVNQYESTYN